MTYYPPSMNDGKHVFVFGSNLAGRHGAGGARDARLNWGALNGCGYGRTGQAFAIPTKDEQIKVLSLPEIKRYVLLFLAYAESQPDITFLVTEIGCGLAGYTAAEISPMFVAATENCTLPTEWLKS